MARRQHRIDPERLNLEAILSYQPAMDIANFGTVVPGKLYRGAQPTGAQFAELKALSVNTIIDLREPWGRATEESYCAALGINHILIPIGDTVLSFGVEPPTNDQLRRIFNYLAGARTVCFVHCEHGEDRTGAVIAAYRMTFEGWTNARAMAEAEAFHINPLQVLIREWIETFKPVAK